MYEDKGEKMMKKAFTLAEVLITLTIIGVIAAITIPNLMQKYTKHQYVVGLKKAYSVLQNAVKMIPITEGCPSGDYDCAGVFNSIDIDGQSFGGSPIKKFLYLLSKNMKVEKLCLEYSTKECQWVHTTNPTTYYGFRTIDGTTYKLDGYNIIVDLNGDQKPNLFGRDKYYFILAQETKNGINAGTVIPYGSKLHYAYTDNNVNNYWRQNMPCGASSVKNSWSYAIFCTGRVLEENAMNY